MTLTMMAICFIKEQTKKKHDHKMNKIPLYIDDWILKKIEVPVQQMAANKLISIWEGPCQIKEEVKIGTFRLAKPDGTLKKLQHVILPLQLFSTFL